MAEPMAPGRARRIRGGSERVDGTVIHPGRPSRIARRLVAGALWLAALVPLATLAVRALADEWRAPALVPQRWGLRGIDAVLHDRGGVAAAVTNSLVVGVATAAIALVVAWPAARALGERRLRRPALVWTILALPVLVPPYAVGTGLTEPAIRLGVADTLAGLALVHLVVALPYAVLALVGGFGPELRAREEAASVHGAGPARRLALVTLPAMAPHLAVAGLLAFLVSWSQYGLSLAVGGGTPMLPLVLVPFVDRDPQVAAVLALIFLAPAVLALALAMRRVGRPGLRTPTWPRRPPRHGPRAG